MLTQIYVDIILLHIPPLDESWLIQHPYVTTILGPL